jgi:hypothetical protein
MGQLRTLSFRSSKTGPSILRSQTLREVLAIVVLIVDRLTVTSFWRLLTYLSKVIEAFLVDGLSREMKC